MNKKVLKKAICIIIVFVVIVLIYSLSSNLFSKSIEQINEKIDEITKITPQKIEPDKVAILKEMQNISRLETAIDRYEQIFQSKRDETRWFGLCGEYLTFIAHGEVVAGIDLSELIMSDIMLIDDNICIKLPKAKIFYSRLDEERSYVQSHSSKLLASRSLDMETKVRKNAILYFNDYAIINNILDRAYYNATIILKDLILNINGLQSSKEKINVIFY